jgi:hypothetical protein
MKILNSFLTFLMILLTVNSFGQQLFDIKNPGNDHYKKCQECISLIENKPKEIQYGVKRDELNKLYLI